MNRKGAIILVVCAAALVGVWRFRDSYRTRQAPDASLGDLLPEIAAGQAEAVSRAKAVAARDWPSGLPIVVGMLVDDNWRLRAVACEILASRGEEALLPLVLPRASDTDWRVRAAAFEAMGQFRRFEGGTPMKNTPLDDRERLLLDWLADRDAHSARPLAPEICELYARAGPVEFGRPLAARCLRCHAGASPQPFDAGAACGRCHKAAHAQWAGSAHANSLSHLRLSTVDANTRSPAVVDWGAVRGIGCTECHRVRGGGAATSASGASAARAGWQ